MRMLMGCLVLVFCGPLVADDKKDEKIDPAKLLGKWAAKERELVVIEFLKDGKLVLRYGEAEKEAAFDGTYKLDGNKLTVNAQPGGKEEKSTVTIKKLTDSEMVVISDTGKDVVMNRVKGK
ncbi:TIGR03066 family protein [Gemmata sp. JC673]|uniref:TIGR03066 family protein n=1 Tax=Gemmata algarum TaxID=2975278 RepID=A0ABU5EQG9_9BACT|nr:TIGR03066 family protein [Gemmata algarum]MDY3557602.1 TIGR03066 family protein [Gemmata algarum]